MGRKPKSEDARLITLAEGKTKIVRIIRGTNRVLIESKDDLTAGDGAKRATIPEKEAFLPQQQPAIVLGY